METRLLSSYNMNRPSAFSRHKSMENSYSDTTEDSACNSTCNSTSPDAQDRDYKTRTSSICDNGQSIEEYTSEKTDNWDDSDISSVKGDSDSEYFDEFTNQEHPHGKGHGDHYICDNDIQIDQACLDLDSSVQIITVNPDSSYESDSSVSSDSSIVPQSKSLSPQKIIHSIKKKLHKKHVKRKKGKCLILSEDSSDSEHEVAPLNLDNYISGLSNLHIKNNDFVEVKVEREGIEDEDLIENSHITNDDMELESPVEGRIDDFSTLLIDVTAPKVERSLLDSCFEKPTPKLPIDADLDEFVDIESFEDTTTYPVLEANNLHSLLEQFEKTEKFNLLECLDRSDDQIDLLCDASENVDTKITVDPNLSAKSFSPRMQDAITLMSKNKMRQLMSPMSCSSPKLNLNSSSESIQLDHDYCSPVKKIQDGTPTKSDETDRVLPSIADKFLSPLRPNLVKNVIPYYSIENKQTGLGKGKCMTNVTQAQDIDCLINKSNHRKKSDHCYSKSNNCDTISNVAVSISADNLVSNNSQSVLKKTAKISLLKCNQIKTETIETSIETIPRKRKLNLQEYKLRREGKSNDSSRTNSPITIEPAKPETNTIEPGEPTKRNMNTVEPAKCEPNTVEPAKRETNTVSGFEPIEKARDATKIILKKRKIAALRKTEDKIVLSKIAKVDTVEILPLTVELNEEPTVLIADENLTFKIRPNSPEYEEIVVVSIGVNTDPIDLNDEQKNSVHFKIAIKKPQLVDRNPAFDGNSDDDDTPAKPQSKCNVKSSPCAPEIPESNPSEHGEDKVIMHLRKDRIKRLTSTAETQTDPDKRFPPLMLLERETETDERMDVSEKNSIPQKSDNDSDNKYSDRARWRDDHIRRDRSRSSGRRRRDRSHRRRSRDRSYDRRRRRNYRSRDRRRRNSSSSDSRSGSYSSKDSRKSYSSLPNKRRSRRSLSRNRKLRARSSSSSRSRSSSSESMSWKCNTTRSDSSHGSRHSYRSGKSRSCYSRERSRTRRNNRDADRSTRLNRDRNKQYFHDSESERPVEERRIVFVGRLEKDITKLALRRAFDQFGVIKEVTLHKKDDGSRYGFLTFSHANDAWVAVGEAHRVPALTKYDVSFGGRRAFCRKRYADLDNIEMDYEDEAMFGHFLPPVVNNRADNLSFDHLLNEMKKKLGSRKPDSRSD